jgi:hypothetical protein
MKSPDVGLEIHRTGLKHAPVDNGSSLEAAFTSRKRLLSLDSPPPIDTILLDDSTLLWSEPEGNPEGKR